LNRATFENVRRIRADEREVPEVLGLFVVAVDHDGSDWDDVRRIARRGVEPLRAELNRLIGRTRGIGNRSNDAIAEAVERVKKLTSPTGTDIAMEALEGLFLPWNLDSFDADDYIGVLRVVYLAVDESFGLSFPGAERLRTTNSVLLRFLGTRDNRTDWAVAAFATKGSEVVR
jgi:hypothetical protein